MNMNMANSQIDNQKKLSIVFLIDHNMIQKLLHQSNKINQMKIIIIRIISSLKKIEIN